MNSYRAPRWLAPHHGFNGHLQTIWPVFFSRRFDGHAPVYRRERWITPDQDFIDLDWLHSTSPDRLTRPLLVLFHGLEGSSSSHYAQAFAHWARENGWQYVVPHFRGCSGEMNLTARAYHSGDHQEIAWILQRLRANHAGPLVAVGVSLGGNALLRWAGEVGEAAQSRVQALAAVSAPLDLARGSQSIGEGFSRWTYTRMFLRSMKPKALKKLGQFPGLFDREQLKAAQTLTAFDDAFTAPLHGFQGVNDYYARASAKPHLHRIRVPALVLNARNDPFLPADCLPRPDEVGPCVTLWQPEHGGHVGFPAGRWPGHVLSLPWGLMAWLQEVVALPSLAKQRPMSR